MSGLTARGLVAYAKRVAKNNAEFGKLKAAEKRVAIAKDALAQLVMGRYEATPGTYVHACGDESKIRGVDVPRCEVCGIGAVMVSSFRLDKKRKKIGVGVCDGRGSGSYIYDGLGMSAFTNDTLRDMEDAFEHDYEEIYPDPEVRLFTILNEVVESGGKFKIRVIDEAEAAEVTLKYLKLKAAV